MTDKSTAGDELRPEYDEAFWKGAARGKYAERHAAAAKTVRIAPDVAASFPNDEAVNEALRLALRVMNDASRLTRRSAGGVIASVHDNVGQFFGDSDLLEAG